MRATSSQIPLPRRVAQRLLSSAQSERLSGLVYRDAGHGYDVFGMDPAWVGAALGLARPVYERYVRVRSRGAENIPRAGAALLVCNHSGQLPIDAAMLWCDVLRHTSPPRVARPVADNFVPVLPFVSTVFSRCGVVQGSRGNVHHLLNSGELVMLFPEGSQGIAKPFRQRYQLSAWHVGHAELAIQHQVPIVPVAIVGAEEQFPLTIKLPVQLFGAPHLPLSIPPVPLPVRYHVTYGEPIDLAREFEPGDARDAAAVEHAATTVRDAVQALVRAGLRARGGIFR